MPDRFARLYPAGERVLKLGPAASESAAKKEDLRQYRYLHFAVHGFADEAHPERSGLVLSQGKDGDQDWILRMDEIALLRLNAFTSSSKPGFLRPKLYVMPSCACSVEESGCGRIPTSGSRLLRFNSIRQMARANGITRRSPGRNLPSNYVNIADERLGFVSQSTGVCGFGGFELACPRDRPRETPDQSADWGHWKLLADLSSKAIVDFGVTSFRPCGRIGKDRVPAAFASETTPLIL